jgi:competence protein ComEC
MVFTSFFLKNTGTQYRFRWLFGSGLFLLLFNLGYVLCLFSESKSAFYPLGERKTFLVTVNSATVEKPKSYRCEIKLNKFLDQNEWKTASGNAVVYFEKSESAKNILLGDELILRTEFKNPPSAENPGGFDYAAYLKQNNIHATAYINAADWYKTTTILPFSIRREANIVRSKLLAIYENYGIKDYEFAVLAALTVGYTDELSPDLRASYSASGAMHILSVSGLHVGIVYVVIAFLLSFLKKNRLQLFLRATLIVLFLWTYAFVTGMSPSVVRSALMFSFVAIGTSLERKSQIYNTVFMSAFLMLLIQPNFIYNIGFQLSYAAVISIVIFQKPFAALLPVRNKILRWLRDLVSVSVAAQIGTLPFTLYYFQQFPNYFLLTNLVAIPLSTIVIYLAITLLAISFIPAIATFIALLLKWSLVALNFCIVEIHHLPFSVALLTLNFAQVLAMVGAITFISLYFYTKKASPLLIGLLCIFVVSLLSLQTTYNTLHSDKIIVYSSSKHLHINFIARDKNYIYSTNSEELSKIAGQYWKMNKIEMPDTIKSNDYFQNNYAILSDKRILIATEQLWKNKTTAKPLEVDLLIIGNKTKPKAINLFENINPKTVIVDKSISPWYTENIRKACVDKSIAFYSIAEEGAFVYKKQH